MTAKAKKTHFAPQLRAGIYEDCIDLGNTGTAQTLDASKSSSFQCVLTGNCTFMLAGAVTGQQCSITLWVTRDATTTRTMAFTGGTIITPGGIGITQPAAAASSVNQYVLTTKDGGTTWALNVGGIGYS